MIITSSGSSSLSPLEVARLQPNGQLDPKFGFAGKVSLSKVGSADLLKLFASDVTTDASSRPLVSLMPDYGMAQAPPPALLRLTG